MRGCVGVGTRFICSEEAGAPVALQKQVMATGHMETVRTLIYSGRPMRVRKVGEVADWEDNRQDEIKRLTSAGKIPVGFAGDSDMETSSYPLIMGQVAAMVNDVLPARVIVENMVKDAAKLLTQANQYVVLASRL
jgi:NAD(P)H-dependent flavin oxidoreductase YrpB (nitropropane dioxygenase family)